eukprot:12575455-Heterocapsa_arctica.AAC.1
MAKCSWHQLAYGLACLPRSLKVQAGRCGMPSAFRGVQLLHSGWSMLMRASMRPLMRSCSPSRYHNPTRDSYASPVNVALQ